MRLREAAGAIFVVALLAVQLRDHWRPQAPEELQAEPPQTTLALSSCLAHDMRPWTGVDFVRAQLRPDVMLLVGDLIYADSPKTLTLPGEPAPLAGESVHDFRLRLMLAEPAVAALLRSTRVLFMWDDHDLIDNYDGGTDTQLYRTARAAYDRHIAPRNPAPAAAGELYYSFGAAGDAVVGFVLDCRSHRSPTAAPDGPGKSMLGATQLAALQRWLLAAPRDALKVLVSSVMWNSDCHRVLLHGKRYLDTWGLYAHERDGLLAFARENGVVGLLLASADAHWPAVVDFGVDAAGNPIYELSASPLHARLLDVAMLDPLPASWLYAENVGHTVVGTVSVGALEAGARSVSLRVYATPSSSSGEELGPTEERFRLDYRIAVAGQEWRQGV